MLLDLSNNTLSGILPNSLGNCSHLTVLKLGVNNFTGEVPGVLANATNLSYLDLADNHFEGSFPSFISELKQLVVLIMGQNHFSGKIPPFIGNLQNIRIMIMESNFFTETIPADINKLQKLQVMDISNNRLSGGIPETLDGLQILTSRPQDGDLLGYVVSAMYMGVEMSMIYKGFTQEFDVVRTYHSGIDLSLNNMTGNIPPGIVHLKGLSMLNLSHNFFSGNIPATIGDMIGLESMDLNFNNLSGDIPNSLNLLDALGTLNLSHNNLSGEIPSGRRMDTLYGDGSGFSGNKYLCGSPEAIINCSSSTEFPTAAQENGDDGDEQDWLLYVFVTVGYGVGLWGYFSFIVFMKVQWREWHWKTIDKIASWTITCCTGKERWQRRARIHVLPKLQR
ncbi:Receptor-like protein EIX2 [Linum perenne]